MQVTIKGTANTDTLELGEVRTVELTPFIRGLIRNGLAEQIPRPTAPKKYAEGGRIERPALNQALSQLSPNAREFAHAPAKKTPAKRAAAKKAAEPDATVLEAAADARDAANALSTARADAAAELADAEQTLTDEE